MITLSFISTVGNILLFLLILSVVICIHELGHFIFAKRARVLCHEFSFGMGPKLWSRKKGETTFSIRAIPFGGFVSMAGEEVQADLVKMGQKIRIGLDQDGEISRIVLNPNHPHFQDFLEITVTEMDLLGKDGEKLFINEYTVKRDAFYVLDKQVIQIAPHDRIFGSKTKWQRFLIAFAGPAMNFVLAFFVFLILFLIAGIPNPESTVVSDVDPEAPAYGILLPEDEITQINGVDVSSWSLSNGTPSVNSELSKYLETETFTLTVIRKGVTKTLAPITPQYHFIGFNFSSRPGGLPLEIFIKPENEKYTDLRTGDIIKQIDGTAFTTWNELIGYQMNYVQGSTPDEPTVLVYERLGVEYTYEFVAYGEEVLSSQGATLFASRLGISGSNRFDFFGSFGLAGASFLGAAGSIFKTLGLLFTSSQVGVGDLQGFIGIFTMTSTAAKDGWATLLNWVGFLSVNLGIINLLPIPALDGGRIVFIVYEAITKRKPNQKVENVLHTLVFFLLMGLLVFVTYNDILRLFGIR